MSWLVKALSICRSDPDSHYLLLDPLSFYEMKYTQVIPKGTRLAKSLPPSETFTEDVILASASLPSSLVENGKLREDVTAAVVLKVGSLKSPHELYDKYVTLDETLKRQLKYFKETSLSQQYIISQTDEPKLYRITESFSGDASLDCYGSIEEVAEKSNDMRQALNESASKKVGRSYDAADLLRVEHIYTYMENGLLPVDPSKIAFLLRKASIKPIARTEDKWINCFTTLNRDAAELRDEIRHFHSMEWVQSLVNPYEQFRL